MQLFPAPDRQSLELTKIETMLGIETEIDFPNFLEPFPEIANGREPIPARFKVT